MRLFFFFLLRGQKLLGDSVSQTGEWHHAYAVFSCIGRARGCEHHHQSRYAETLFGIAKIVLDYMLSFQFELSGSRFYFLV